MQLRWSTTLLYMVTLVCGFNVPTQAGFIVSVSDLDLQPGGSGFVDVMIQSDSGSPMNLSAYNFEFRIDTLGATRLEFVDPQPDPQLTDSSYVFSGDSADAFFSAPVGAVSSPVVPHDTFIGGDATLSGADVSVSDPKLLARLDVTTVTSLPPVAGDQFTISLISSDNTVFLDSSFNNFTFESLPFDSTPGTVTITQTVPEPSGLLLLSLGALCLLFAASQSKARSKAYT